MILARFRRLALRDENGSIAVEMAFVVPILATFALGAFEIGTIFSRQQELQAAALEGETIALAVARGAEIHVDEIEDIIKTTARLGDDNVNVTRFYRCDADANTVDNPALCIAEGAVDGETTEGGEEADKPVVSSYLRIEVTDSYTPVWKDFGIGDTINYDVERTVQVS